ncbi:SURF1 family protein [Breoghania sp.]|uniref:SURF1 family protein n=1 Tax=Breoghania sp. TaxID=2065378 RepID=UPI002AA86732|nr:SURF1 family protein [Breoghania sp.]
MSVSEAADPREHETTGPHRRSRATLALVGSLVVFGMVAGTALGVWQVKRLGWKLALIERVETRIHAPAQSAPGPEDWPAITRETAEYRPVTVAGHFDNANETLVRATTDLGSGYWVVTPFKTERGFTVLVNRGFVPPEKKDPATRPSPESDAPVTVSGLLRMSEPGGAFLRDNAPDEDRWYSRDVAAITTSRGLGETASYFIDADASSSPPEAYPVGGLTVVRFHNNHLVYAITWFSLALMSFGAGLYILREERRAHRA